MVELGVGVSVSCPPAASARTSTLSAVPWCVEQGCGGAGVVGRLLPSRSATTSTRPDTPCSNQGGAPKMTLAVGVLDSSVLPRFARTSTSLAASSSAPSFVAPPVLAELASGGVGVGYSLVSARSATTSTPAAMPHSMTASAMQTVRMDLPTFLLVPGFARMSMARCASRAWLMPCIVVGASDRSLVTGYALASTPVRERTGM